MAIGSAQPINVTVNVNGVPATSTVSASGIPAASPAGPTAAAAHPAGCTCSCCCPSAAATDPSQVGGSPVAPTSSTPATTPTATAPACGVWGNDQFTYVGARHPHAPGVPIGNAMRPPQLGSNPTADGSLTLSAEAKRRADALFRKMDTDHDGTVSKQEMEAFFVARAGRREVYAATTSSNSAATVAPPLAPAPTPAPAAAAPGNAITTAWQQFEQVPPDSGTAGDIAGPATSTSAQATATPDATAGQASAPAPAAADAAAPAVPPPAWPTDPAAADPATLTPPSGTVSALGTTTTGTAPTGATPPAAPAAPAPAAASTDPNAASY